MIAVDTDRPAAREFELLAHSVVCVAGIYGPNASGKSNILDALAWLSSSVSRSLRAWDEFVPRDPFRFGHGPSSTSSFALDLLVDGVRFAYELEIDDEHVLFEQLTSYPERRPRILFERREMELKFRRGLQGYSPTKELLTPTTLVLSSAMRFPIPEIRDFARAVARINVLGLRPRRTSRAAPYRTRYSTTQVFLEGLEDRLPIPDDSAIPPDAAIAMLRFADLGIDDVSVEMLPAPDGATGNRLYLRLIHKVGDERIPFDLADESEGTQTWFRLIGPTLQALQTGQILLFDEIDASLHPKLSAMLIELFQDPASNPKNAQLIFTTHDTSLLHHLNRDEVWLTEKNDDGETRLTALAEFGGDKVRRSSNLERSYLQGRFGGVPEPDQLFLYKALGLALGARGE